MDDLLEAEREYRDYSADGKISMASVQRGMTRLAQQGDQWAGIPMPLNGENLVIEESYKFAEAMVTVGMAVSRPAVERPSRTFVCSVSDVDETQQQEKIRNTFWSWHRRSDIIVHELNGTITWGLIPGVHHAYMDLHTMGCADAWSLDVELKALSTLRELTSHRQFRQYVLAGMFIESSQRSHVKYIFRRLRPTIALGKDRRGELKILCTLCLHPIAYYSGSWAGAMCPTDDVLAHLMLMRGDEPMFWRRANQHPSYRPEAGL